MHGLVSVCAPACVYRHAASALQENKGCLCREVGQWLTFAFPSQQSCPAAEVWILHLDVLLETEALMPCWSTCKPASNLAASSFPHPPSGPSLRDVFTIEPFHWVDSGPHVYNIFSSISVCHVFYLLQWLTHPFALFTAVMARSTCLELVMTLYTTNVNSQTQMLLMSNN